MRNNKIHDRDKDPQGRGADQNDLSRFDQLAAGGPRNFL